jgi:hypothetical protein
MGAASERRQDEEAISPQERMPLGVLWQAVLVLAAVVGSPEGSGPCGEVSPFPILD